MVAIQDKKSHTHNATYATTPAADHITALDADRAVEALQTFAFAHHGSTRWQRQHEDLTRLNVQAHLNALHHRDEFVVEAILLHQKMPLLIREIVAADLYKQHAFPRLKEWLATNASIKGYLLLYNEAVLANLLEAALYHPRAAISAGDAAAELVDWCHRRLVWLHGAEYEPPPPPPAEPEALRAQLLAEADARDHLSESATSISYSTALCSLSLLRFLSEQLEALPLAVSSRLLDTYDTPMVLCSLLERKPWEHVAADGTMRRFGQSGWAVVAAADRRTVAKAEAQAWLALYALVTDADARRKYALTSHRREALLRLRAQLHEGVVDQLPPLAHLGRSLDELALMAEAPGGAAATRPAYVLEAVPELRDNLLRGVDWDQVVEEQKRDALHESMEERRAAAARLAALYDSEGLEAMLEGGGPHGGGSAAAPRTALWLEVEIGNGDEGGWVRLDAQADALEGTQTPLVLSRAHKTLLIADGACSEVRARLHGVGSRALEVSGSLDLEPTHRKQWAQVGFSPHALRLQLHFLRAPDGGAGYHLIHCRATPPLEQTLSLQFFEAGASEETQPPAAAVIRATGHGLTAQTPFDVIDPSVRVPRGAARVTAELACGDTLLTLDETPIELSAKEQMVWRQLGKRADELRVQLKLAPAAGGGYALTAVRVTTPPSLRDTNAASSA